MNITNNKHRNRCKLTESCPILLSEALFDREACTTTLHAPQKRPVTAAQMLDGQCHFSTLTVVYYSRAHGCGEGQHKLGFTSFILWEKRREPDRVQHLQRGKRSLSSKKLMKVCFSFAKPLEETEDDAL